MEWSEDIIDRLRGLWAEGHSTAEIGRRLGVTKNAVVGKAHRLDLPARPSPIRRDATGASRPRAPRRISGPTLPPLASTRAPMPESRLPAVALQGPRPAMLVPRAPAAARPPEPRPYARVVPCSWPIGEPGTRAFRFCDCDSVPGKPYCVEHAALAYIRVKDRRDDAA